MRNILACVLCVSMLAACAKPSEPATAPSGEPDAAAPSAVGNTPSVEAEPAVAGTAGAPAGHGPGKPAPPMPNVVLAAVVHGQAGASLDAADQAVLNRSTQQALESANTNEAVQWQNSDTGHYGTIKPTRTFQPAPTQICREFQQTVVVSGKTQQAYGTACRQLDGTWRLKI